MEKAKEIKVTKEEMEEIKAGFRHLSDDELDGVAGGFVSEDGASWKYDVMCPCCGNDDIRSINIGPKWRHGNYDIFYCRNCGNPFGVDIDGWTFSLRQ